MNLITFIAFCVFLCFLQSWLICLDSKEKKLALEILLKDKQV